MIRAALVSYLNTKPFLDGLKAEFSNEELAIELLPPAKCAAYLSEGKGDIALIPVGALPDFQGVELLADHCIGAEGEVDSVFLLANEPVEKLKTIIRDPHSRTSNLLAQFLMENYWHLDPEFLSTSNRDFSLAKGDTGVVAIGDKAHAEAENFKFVYDLAGEWKKATGLPFVFAVWAMIPDRISESDILRFEKALSRGVQGREESAKRYASEFNMSLASAVEYLTQRISFQLDGPKQTALGQFMDWVRKEK